MWSICNDTYLNKSDHVQVIDRYRFMDLLPLTTTELVSVGYKVIITYIITLLKAGQNLSP